MSECYSSNAIESVCKIPYFVMLAAGKQAWAERMRQPCSSDTQHGNLTA